MLLVLSCFRSKGNHMQKGETCAVLIREGYGIGQCRCLVNQVGCIEQVLQLNLLTRMAGNMWPHTQYGTREMADNLLGGRAEHKPPEMLSTTRANYGEIDVIGTNDVLNAFVDLSFSQYAVNWDALAASQSRGRRVKLIHQIGPRLLEGK